MKAKRKRVPAALHSELTEYSSLIRALRTSNTLDVTSQLTPSASLSRPASPSVASTQSKIRSKKQKKDTWTRWPLLPEDVPVPKWNFEDEVAIIAKQVL
ncbi:hypothetical protein K435DRAFT_702800, partial [Dendrothele bispora CBS 962.96]